MKKIFFIFFALHFALLITHSQPSITWNRLYDGGYYNEDYGYGLCKTTDGNYVLGGWSYRWPVPGGMYVKIDPYGNVIWLKNAYTTCEGAITATSDGGVLAAGGEAVCKINTIGDSTWGYSYSAYNVSNLYDIIQCSDGGFVTCGSADLYNSFFIMKVDSLGHFLWRQTLPYPGLDPRFRAVCETYSNDYIVAGRKYAINYNESVMARFDANGQMKWMKAFGEGDSLGSGMRIIKQPPYYIVACGNGYMKIDDSGNVVTAKLIPRDTNYAIADMQFITNDKFVIVTNNRSVPGSYFTKISIIDTNRHIFSTRAVLFSNFIRLSKIELAGNGDIVFGGDASRYDTSSMDFYALRCDSNLNFPPIGIKSISGTVPNQFHLYQNYPNPFNPETKIKFSIPAVGQRHAFDVRMVVYDILGKEVAVLVNHELKPGKYEVTWDGTNYPSGVYFYRLSTGSYFETKKMVLLK